MSTGAHGRAREFMTFPCYDINIFIDKLKKGTQLAVVAAIKMQLQRERK